MALVQSIDYRCPKLLGVLKGQILYDQIRAVAPRYRDLKQPSAGVPEDVGLRLPAAQLLERRELLAVGEAIPG